MDRPVLETLRLRLEPLATRHADAVHAINGDAVKEMMARGMCALTGAMNEADAWRHFFSHDQ